MFDIFGRKRIAQLEEANRNLNRRLEQWENDLGPKLEKALKHTAVYDRAVGRIIAKLDPMYGRDEADPVRKAESDRISDEAIGRIYAEHAASNRLP